MKPPLIRPGKLDAMWFATAAFAILGFGTLSFQPHPAAQVTGTAKRNADTYRYLVFSDPVAGKDDEYNAWYDTQHAPDVVAVPGFVSAQRFVASDTQIRKTTTPTKYLVVYTIVTDDLSAVMAEVSRRVRTGMTVMSPAFDGTAPSPGGIYKVIGPLVEHRGAAPAAPIGDVHTYAVLVFSNPVAGHESEYNTWYDTQHLPDMVAVPGFANGQRLALTSGSTRPGQTTYRYLVMYTITTDILPSVFDAFRQRSPTMVTSPAFGESAGYTYRTWGPLLSGDAVRAARAKATP